MAVPKDSNQLLEAAEQMWAMLDVLSEENPEEYKKLIDQQLKEGVDSISPPQPAYCISCTTQHRGRSHKLYINICKWAKIPSPQGDTDPVPVKGGILRHLVKNGKKTSDLLYDVAFSPQFLEECQQKVPLQDMLNSLIIRFIEDMIKLKINQESLKKMKSDFKGPRADIPNSLDERFNHFLPMESRLDIGDTILEELSRMGLSEHSKESELPPLRLFPESQDKRKLIEELPEGYRSHNDRTVEQAGNIKDAVKKNGRKKSKEKVKQMKGSKEDINVGIGLRLDDDRSTTDTVQCPKYLINTSKDDNGEFVRITVDLPGVTSATSIDLEISEEDLVLNVEDMYKLYLEFPIRVDDNKVKAKFNSAKSELLITIASITL